MGAISSQQRAIHYLFDENENYVGTKEDIRGNEIVYDSQGVKERTFSRLIDNFYLFQRIFTYSPPSIRRLSLSEGARGKFILQYIDY